MSKLTQIIESHLPKERDMIKSGDPFEAMMEALGDKEFNSCLSEIKKAIPKIEEEIVKEYRKNIEIFCLAYPTTYNRQVFDIPVGCIEKLLNDFLTTLTK